jgi:hypothetical protein
MTDSGLSEADQKFLDGKRSHAQRETIAYCPECQKELDDFDLRTDRQRPGRCRSCGTVAWMSFEAQSLLLSDFVTLRSLRNTRNSEPGTSQEGDQP